VALVSNEKKVTIKKGKLTPNIFPNIRPIIGNFAYRWDFLFVDCWYDGAEYYNIAGGIGDLSGKQTSLVWKPASLGQFDVTWRKSDGEMGAIIRVNPTDTVVFILRRKGKDLSIEVSCPTHNLATFGYCEIPNLQRLRNIQLANPAKLDLTINVTLSNVG
jgi:hypothetical protein